MNKPITNAQMTRWLLLLQEFDITIVDRPGKENLVADFLSRLHINDDNSPVYDSFSDEHLFVVLLTHLGMHTLLIIWLQGRYLHIYLLGKEGKLLKRVLGTVG